MKKEIKYIGIFLLLIITIILIIFFINLFANKNSQNEEEEQIKLIHEVNTTEADREQALVVYLENKIEEQEVQEEVKEEKKDPYVLTNEIYSINGPIGNLKIPKTNLNTEVFSNQTVDKMEEMPCFLYTTGGLNKVGTTLIVGHNRVNNTLFSNNSKLEAGDEFYFTDLSGIELKYTIKSKTIMPDTDTSFLTDEVDKPTIVLSCCTDNNDDYRIIIIGQANL